MRLLLGKQRQLVRDMSADARSRSPGKAESGELMFKELISSSCVDSAAFAQTPSEMRLLSDKVRALCDEIGRQAQSLNDG